jgi:tripartite-type tricarboxylate transporter receptor subunit TctC
MTRLGVAAVVAALSVASAAAQPYPAHSVTVIASFPAGGPSDVQARVLAEPLHVSYRHGVWAPKGTPKDIVARLNAAVVAALADANVLRRYAEIGQEAWPRAQQTPEVLAAFHKTETEKWWPIVRASKLKAE